MGSIASSLFAWSRVSARQPLTSRSTRSASPPRSRELNALTLSMWGCLMGALLTPAYSSAACLLAYDHAVPIEQGDLLGRVGVQLGGGENAWGLGAEGQLGLSGDRSLHLRSGACERSNVAGWAIETGVTQRIMAHSGHLSGDERSSHAKGPYFQGPLDLGMRVTFVSFAGDQINGESRSDLGMQVAALVSYPLWFDQRTTSGVGRVRFARAAVGLALGVSSYASDRRQLVESSTPLSSARDTLLSSSWVWSELIAFNAHYYLSDRLLLSAETRWVEGGLLAGLSVGYQL